MNIKARERINGSIWPLVVSVLLTTNGIFLGFLVSKVNKIYDTVIENRVKVQDHEKRLNNIEEILRE